MAQKSKGRRARENDPNRMAIPDKDRPIMRELVREFESRLDKAGEKIMERAGIHDPEKHRQQHESLDDLWPSFKADLLPYVQAQYKKTKVWTERMEKVKDSTVTAVVWLIVLFILLSAYFGGSAAIKSMVGP